MSPSADGSLRGSRHTRTMHFPWRARRRPGRASSMVTVSRHTCVPATVAAGSPCSPLRGCLQNSVILSRGEPSPLFSLKIRPSPRRSISLLGLITITAPSRSVIVPVPFIIVQGEADLSGRVFTKTNKEGAFGIGRDLLQQFNNKVKSAAVAK